MKGHSHKRRVVEKKDVLVYVPLLSTIECLLDDSGVMAEVTPLVFTSCQRSCEIVMYTH